MTQNLNDLRARRTRKLLQDALLELIEERGFDALTVEALASRAMVSRSAFYRYYQDKYNLVEQIFEDAMSALMNTVGEIGPEHPPQAWVKFFEHIAEYERFYGALLGRKGSPWFVMKMRASLAGMVKKHERPKTDTFSDDFVPDLVSTLFVESIIWWLEHGRPYTPKEIAIRSAFLASALFQEASTWH